MPSTHRIRERTFGYIDGGTLGFTKPPYDVDPYITYGYTGHLEHEICSDFTSTKPYPDTVLDLRRSEVVSPLRINGGFYAGGLGDCVIDNYGPVGTNNVELVAGSRMSSPFNPDYYMTKALSNMNPKKPDLDLPLFLFELKDLPRMLMDIGKFAANAGERVGTWGEVLYGVYGDKLHLADIPGTFLSYRFGWAPLLADLANLLQLGKLIDRRVQYLKNLESGHHLRRKLFSGRTAQDTNRGPAYVIKTLTGQKVYTADVYEEQYMDVWYTANAKLRTQLPEAPSELRSMSKEYVLGLTYRNRFWWDILPFSWLSDYLNNFGDVIESRQSLAELEITRLNIMHQIRYFRSHKNVYVPSGVEATPYLCTVTQKERRPYANPTPRLTYRPLMNGIMYATIGALALNVVLKGRVSTAWYR